LDLTVASLVSEWLCLSDVRRPVISPWRVGRCQEGLHWRLAVAPAPLMWSLVVVPGDPGIEVGLQLLDAGVDAFAERHLIEFLQDGFVEALTDAVGLRASR